MTKIKLETNSDIDVHLFIEKGMRGGISYIAKRHSKINDCENGKEKNLLFIGIRIIYMALESFNPYQLVILIF